MRIEASSNKRVGCLVKVVVVKECTWKAVKPTNGIAALPGGGGG
jgi:hypothetical protein